MSGKLPLIVHVLAALLLLGANALLGGRYAIFSQVDGRLEELRAQAKSQPLSVLAEVVTIRARAAGSRVLVGRADALEEQALAGWVRATGDLLGGVQVEAGQHVLSADGLALRTQALPASVASRAREFRLEHEASGERVHFPAGKEGTVNLAQVRQEGRWKAFLVVARVPTPLLLPLPTIEVVRR